MITLKDIKSELKLFHPYGILSIDVPDEGINFEELENELLKKPWLRPIMLPQRRQGCSE